MYCRNIGYIFVEGGVQGRGVTVHEKREGVGVVALKQTCKINVRSDASNLNLTLILRSVG